MIVLGLGSLALFGLWGVSMEMIRVWHKEDCSLAGWLVTVVIARTSGWILGALLNNLMEGDDDVGIIALAVALWVMLSGIAYNYNSIFRTHDSVSKLGKLFMLPAIAAASVAKPILFTLAYVCNVASSVFKRKETVAA